VSVVNQGAISADVANGTLVINAQPFSNQGLIGNPAGTLLLEGTVSDGGLGNLHSGNGLLGLTGVLTNTGQTLALNGATNTLTLRGGTILDGTIATANGASFVVQSGILDGVTVNGVLDVGNTYDEVSLEVTNGLTLDGTALIGNPTNNNSGGMEFLGSQTLGGDGTVVFGGSIYEPQCGSVKANTLWLAYAGTTLTIGGGITVEGQNGTVGAYTGCPWNGPANVSVVNQGAISADVANGTLVINAQPFSNLGMLAMQGGMITLAGSADLSRGTLNLGINGPGSSGQINCGGSILLDGTFSATLRDGFQPNPGESFTVLLNSSSPVAFSCLSLDLGGGFLLQPQISGSVLTLTTVTYTTNASHPQMFITDSGDGITLQWPLGFPGWVLQTTTNLAAPVWAPVSVTCGNEAVVPVAAAQQYFRLRIGN
jgi:hypothetical protein